MPNTVGILLITKFRFSRCSFLEMLDELNNELELKGEDPIAFEHDCREGICGTCGLVYQWSPTWPYLKLLPVSSYA